MKSMYPIILGMDPPTKEIVMVKTGKAVDMYICHAEFPEGTKPGEYIESRDFNEIKGLAAWLRFTDKKTMVKLGEILIKSAEELDKTV